ncbi:MAG: PPOX class F420-dependent oxidoreductase [Nitrospinota bacterium]
MKWTEALSFLGQNHRGVLATLRADGAAQLTPVLYALVGEVIRISGTEGRAKTRNLRRDPRASLCVLTEEFFPPYLTVEGRVRIVADPTGEENARLYEAITGAPPRDMAEYLAAMKRERRLIYELSIERMYPLEN